MSNVPPATIAAIDLGSNSFHMIVAHTVGDHFRVVDRIRHMVRLGAGLGPDNQLSAAAMTRALECLAQFGERVRGLPADAVRVVGTNTLRKARNTASFLAQAEHLLGHRIDVISGHEEARLIYLGVSHGLDDDADVRLVVDIGGGSSEFILGRRFDPLYMESLYMGCVSHTAAHFGDGQLSAARFKAAELAARQELEAIETSYRRIGWQSVIGASGTILTAGDVLRQMGGAQDGITSAELARLKQMLVDAGHVDRVNLPGLAEERRPDFPGGIAILSAIFDALGISRMRLSDSAIREGLLYDLLGRIHQEDVRERAVGELLSRYWLEAVDRSRNIARQYSVALSQDMFGISIVEFSWSRIGTRGQSRRVSFAKQRDAERFVAQLLRRRAGAPKRIGVAYHEVQQGGEPPKTQVNALFS